ncbi:hypothetical protein PV04_07556 [Phialophora macrospora]|uniref:Nitrogen regulatory protein areA GATA-like domain-containing protein n=1 Tax=Phialophora macrospora TaxID=1851006 RepID=A0A0D2FEH9_9EURO|nr:hypothetical protein PV04_07556 [Phialophora macrospora]
MTTILQVPLAGASPFSSSPVHSSSYPDLSSLNSSTPFGQHPSQPTRYSHHEYARVYPDSGPSTAPSSPQLTYSSRRDSYSSTPASSLSLDRGDELDEEDDDDMAFPAFRNSEISTKAIEATAVVAEGDDLPTQIPSPPGEDPSLSSGSIQDDQAIEPEPTRHVDYLSHEWKEEDIWKSWSYVSHRRGSLANATRLENASWRSWTKAKNRLRTISPETLNWLKDCDVTWLYGPLQTSWSASQSLHNTSPPPSRLSHASSFITKKPILKKKSASAAILERSRSQHSLLQRAGDIIKIQQSNSASGRPMLRRGNSEFVLPRYDTSSVANTPIEHETPGFTESQSSFTFDIPTPSECKHVLFDEEVRQVQAIDSDDDDKPDEDDVVFDTDEDDDGGLMMAPSQRSGRGSSRTTPRGSFSGESKTIVPLPSTTLKYRTDTPEPPQMANGFWHTGRKLSPSPSQETLRPTNPHQNFLIDDDPEVEDGPWQPQSSHGDEQSPYEDEGDEADDHPTMRRTESGMFMPYEDEDEAAMNSTLFGQAMYAVNTFRDIAHVVWNVGWNRK